MTVLVAMHDSISKCTWIGSDTFACMGPIKFTCPPKWIIGPYWALGCAGDARLGNLVRARFIDELKDSNDAFTVSDKLRTLLKNDGWNTNTDPGAPDFAIWSMLASPHGVWSICTAFSIDLMEGYWADGSGSQVAMGAMFSASMSKLPPKDIVKTGIEAAIAHERSCGGEVWMEKLVMQPVRAAAE